MESKETSTVNYYKKSKTISQNNRKDNKSININDSTDDKLLYMSVSKFQNKHFSEHVNITNIQNHELIDQEQTSKMRTDKFGVPITKGGKKHRIIFKDKLQNNPDSLLDIVKIKSILSKHNSDNQVDGFNQLNEEDTKKDNCSCLCIIY